MSVDEVVCVEVVEFDVLVAVIEYPVMVLPLLLEGAVQLMVAIVLLTDKDAVTLVGVPGSV